MAKKKSAKGKSNIGVGLDKKEADRLVKGLNDLLANYQVHYQNLRGCHWNIVGPGFFELHAKFEELYTKAHTFIDEVAERILTLEGQPLHTYSDYLKQASIREVRKVSDAKGTVNAGMSDMEKLIALQRTVLDIADKADDEATSTLVGDNVTVMEKDLWMLRAYSS